MFVYISTENGNWRQSISRVTTDEQAIFFKVVDDDGTAVNLTGESANITITYHNGDVAVDDKATTLVTAASGIVSYTPIAAERAKMFRSGLYRCKLYTTISTVDEYNTNLVQIMMQDG